MPPVKDLTGQRFGRLRVIARGPAGKRPVAYWLCLCDPLLGGCGKGVSVASYSLRDGSTRSCGCLYRDTVFDRYAGRDDPQVSYRPSSDDRKWLGAYARQTGRSVNAVLNEALAEYRARRTGDSRASVSRPTA